MTGHHLDGQQGQEHAGSGLAPTLPSTLFSARSHLVLVSLAWDLRPQASISARPSMSTVPHTHLTPGQKSETRPTGKVELLLLG